MTVSSTTRKAGPFTGNGSQTVFPFTFKVFTKYDLEVVSADTSGTETTLVVDSDYTVFLNADQDNSPGGTITLSAALASGYLLVVVGDLEFSQDTDLPTGGAFNATNVENALDRLTMLCQQLRELTTRAVSVGPTSSVSGDQLLVEINQAVVDSAASAASALLSLNTFKAQYYGVLATDPTLDPLGGAMTQGDLYFSSSLLRMRAYSGSAWVDVGVATPVTINTQRFSGTGSQTVFTLTNAPAFQNAADVYVGGVPQVPGVNFTITGAGLTTLTFLTGAPPAGTNNIFVKTINAYAGGVPNDGSVTAAKMAAGAATGAALGADVVQTSGAQAIAGVKTFSNQAVLNAGAAFSDGSAQNTAYIGKKFQVFSASGTFTVPQGITAIAVTLYSGGGGGQGGEGGTRGGLRGNTGGSAKAIITGLTPGATIAVTVGGGGSGGSGTLNTQPANGGTGGTTSFGAYVSITGAGGGGTSITGTGSWSGCLAISGGSAPLNGGSGNNGATFAPTCTSYIGGGGGGGSWSSGGGGGAGATNLGAAAASAGAIYNSGYGQSAGANGVAAGTGWVPTAGGAGGNNGGGSTGGAAGAGGPSFGGGGGGGGGAGAVIVEW